LCCSNRSAVPSIRDCTVRYRHSLDARRAAWRRKLSRRRSQRPRRRRVRPRSAARRSNDAASERNAPSCRRLLFEPATSKVGCLRSLEMTLVQVEDGGRLRDRGSKLRTEGGSQEPVLPVELGLGPNPVSVVRRNSTRQRIRSSDISPTPSNIVGMSISRPIPCWFKNIRETKRRSPES
jgi:hypothetical protein